MLIAIVFAALAVIAPYFTIRAMKQQEKVVILDPGGTLIYSPLLGFEEAGQLHAYHARLACLVAEYNEGYIYLCLDRWELVRRSGHYLKYGSEYLYCVARKLGLERLLKERRIPTLIHCKLFYDWLTPKFRKDLMGIIFEDLFSYLLGEPMEDSNYLLFSIKVQKPIPPQNIIHMEQVKNFYSDL